ncbi:MAG TPA: hypothetical protein VMV31_14225 [Terriglobales bacterium]|nr:hypothetical protein [Terriglobales bacterium]
MRFQKKIVNQSESGAAVAEPPAAVNELEQQERVVATMAARLGVVEARISEYRASYTEAARGAALGTLPADSPSVWLSKISEQQVRRDGLASALEMERQRLAVLIAERQQADAEAAAAAHLDQFSALATQLQDAGARAASAWEVLASALFDMRAAMGRLNEERFRPQRGTALTGEAWAQFKNLRLVAFNAGRPILNSVTVEVSAIGPRPR